MSFWDDDWLKDCANWHRRILIGGMAHYCPEWDFLPIDETCPEIQGCICKQQTLLTYEPKLP